MSAAEDRDDFCRAVLIARWNLTHERPEGTWNEVYWTLIPDDIRDALDAITERALEACRKRTSGVTSEEFWDGILHALCDFTTEAFWYGLTSGHVAADGRVDLPFRLFPELAGLAR